MREGILQKIIVLLLCVAMVLGDHTFLAFAAEQDTSLENEAENVDSVSENEIIDESDENISNDQEEDKENFEEEIEDSVDDPESVDLSLNEDDIAAEEGRITVSDSAIKEKKKALILDGKVYVDYDGNGENVSGIPEMSVGKYGDTLSISSTAPEREGYYFTGWCDERCGYGDYFYGSEEVQLTRGITLFAQWKESASEDEIYDFGEKKDAPGQNVSGLNGESTYNLETDDGEAFINAFEHKYGGDWERWSQKDHYDARFRAYGCFIIAAAKHIREIAEENHDPSFAVVELAVDGNGNPLMKKIANWGAVKMEPFSLDPDLLWIWSIQTGDNTPLSSPNIATVGFGDGLFKKYVENHNYSYSESSEINYANDGKNGVVYQELLTPNHYVSGYCPNHVFMLSKKRSKEYKYAVVLDHVVSNGDRPINRSIEQPVNGGNSVYMSSYKVYTITPNIPPHECQIANYPNCDVWQCYYRFSDGSICYKKIDPAYRVISNTRESEYYTSKDGGNHPVREYPYSDAYTRYTFSSRDKVIVVGKVENEWEYRAKTNPSKYKANLGHFWYQVQIVKSDGEMVEGFVYDNNLKRSYIPIPVPSVSISEAERLTTKTSSVNVGSSLGLRGKVVSTNGKIQKIDACFVDKQTGAELIDTKKKWSYTSYPNSASVNISGEINNNLYVNTLSAGKYCFRLKITAKNDYNGTTTTNSLDSTEFTVKGASAPVVVVNAPRFIESSYVGGKRITILSNNSGGTLYFSTNNWASKESTSSSESRAIDVRTNGTVVRAYYEKSGKRQEASYAVSVPSTRTPHIYSNQNAYNSMISIDAEAGSTTYYRINGGAVNQYVGPFPVTSACNITAYSEKSGCTRSSDGNCQVTMTIPSVPRISCDTKSDIAAGRAISMHWAKDAKAAEYTIIIKKDGVNWKQDVVSGQQYTFNTVDPGVYTVTAYASNFVGKTEISNEIKVTAHPPVKVRFEDYDGRLVSEQIIDYGESATRPAAQSRRGYTFVGWNGGYTNVTEDVLVVAEYEINVYSVRFYDIDGDRFLGSQSVTFDEGIDPSQYVDKVTITNGGRSFAEWAIFYAKEDDSYMDLEHVDSDMNVRAVTTWTNEDLPVYVDNLRVTVAYGETSDVFAGYNVTADISTTDRQDIRAKVLVTLLNDAGAGVYKMVNAKINTMHFTSDTCNQSIDMFIACDGITKADRVEVSVVSIESADRTGGLIAESKYCDISAIASKSWSAWLTAEQLAAKGHSIGESNVESKREYRFRENTKSTKQTTSAVPDAGYTFLSDNSYYTNDWSGWSDSRPGSYANRQIDTRTVPVSDGYTQYRYGCWVNGNAWQDHYCKSCGEGYYRSHADPTGKYLSGSYTTRYTDWSTNRLSTSGLRHEVCNASGHTRVGNSFYNYKINSKNYWWEESRWIDTSYNKTQYRYRDIHPLYTHYKWVDGSWSGWSDEVIVDPNPSDRALEVEQRTVYRYVLFDAGELSTDTSGNTYRVRGTMNNESLNGKKASILVYRFRNNDPTETQLEYVGQTTLSGSGDYDFSFIPKEEPSFATFDFIVTLAVEGCDSLINIDQIRYEREKYKVVFEDEGIISEQEVYAGESALAPEIPEKEGYDFIGWSRSLSNITKDTVVYAKYRPKSYSIVFVDYVNTSTIIKREDYGTAIAFPDDPIHEGYTFDGWTVENDHTVTGDMVITAKWIPKKFKVTFLDEDGVEIETQEVEYGGTAIPPIYERTQTEGAFAGWSLEQNWWNICFDVTVSPVIMNTKVLGMPSSNVALVNEGIEGEIELLAEEGATIFYTTDGSDPLTGELENMDLFPGEEGYTVGEIHEYSEPFVLEGTTKIKAMARREGYADSEVCEFTYRSPEDRDPSENDYSETIMLTRKNVDVSEGDQVMLTFNLNEDIGLKSTEFRIQLDPAVFAPAIMDGDTQVFRGTLCHGEDDLYVRPYEDKTGISIFWRGDYPTEGTGSLFSLPLYVFPKEGVSSYPIEVSYVTGETFDKDGYDVALDSAVEIAITKNEEEIIGESGLVVSPIVDQTYTGMPIKPIVVVKDNDVLLKEGVDYALTYKNNILIGDASDDDAPTVIIKGKGNYEDEIPITFTIREADINSPDISDNGPFVFKFTGKPQKIKLKLTRNKKSLSEKKDYTVEFLDSDKKPIAPESIVATGHYYVRAKGFANYTGDRDIDIFVSDNDPLSKAVISKIGPQKYTGEAVTPAISVTLPGKTLRAGIDYTVTYSNNIEVGTATVTIEGIGDYAGTKQATFIIEGKSISKLKVEGLTNHEFDGRYFRPLLTILLDWHTALHEGRDYEVVYSNNRNVGTATVEIIGKGEYTGRLVKTFKILPRELDPLEIRAQLYDRGEILDTYKPVARYIKGGVCPTVTLTEPYSIYNQLPLRQNVDYTVTYKNNNKVTDSKKKANIVITGRGNYKGKITVEFEIEPQDISKLDVTAQDVVYNGKSNRFKTSVSIRDLNGKALRAGSDYSKEYEYRYLSKTSLPSGVVRGAGDPVERWDVVPAGTKLQVTVRGLGAYADSVTQAEYAVVSASIAKARFAFKRKEYTGKAVTLDPAQDEIKVVVNGKKLVYGEDYVITGYADNIAKGNAKVFIKGIGNYGGKAEGTFTISGRNLLWWLK